MTITKARFEQGMTYAEYKAQMTRNQEQFDENERSLVIDPNDLAFFRSLDAPVNVVVITEDWCGDAIANVPVLGRLAEVSGKLNLRIFLRDQNLDLMDQYLKEGKHRSIPTFVLFDADFNELGYWIERPARVTEKMNAMRADLFANDPAFADVPADTPFGELPEAARTRLGQAFAAFRRETRDFANAEVVRELRELVQGKRQATPQSPAAQTSPAVQRPAASGSAGDGPVKVTITYCASCGYEPQTVELVSALMYEFRYQLASIEILPWHDGTFDVHVGGELVHSMVRDGGFPAPATIIDAVKAQIGLKTPA